MTALQDASICKHVCLLIFNKASCSKCDRVECACQECDYCDEVKPPPEFTTSCDYEDCCNDYQVYCNNCFEEGVENGRIGKFHPNCLPIEWGILDAFNKWGFDDGSSDRNYTDEIVSHIEALGYEVECDSWGCHNYFIQEISRSGQVVYGGDTTPLWLSDYLDGKTLYNCLPDDIYKTLLLFDANCSIGGYVSLDEDQDEEPAEYFVPKPGKVWCDLKNHWVPRHRTWNNIEEVNGRKLDLEFVGNPARCFDCYKAKKVAKECSRRHPNLQYSADELRQARKAHKKKHPFNSSISSSSTD